MLARSHMLAVVLCAMSCSIYAQQPPIEALTSVTPTVGEVSIAQIDGKWVKAPSRKVAAVLQVDGQAKWVQCRVHKLVTVKIGNQSIDVLSAAPVEVVEIAAESGRCFGIVAGAGKYHCEVVCSDPDTGISTEATVVAIGKPKPDPVVVDPVDPVDPVKELPFESDGFACIIIKEASSTGSLPGAQRSIFSSADIHKLARGASVKLSDGEPFYRVWDDDYTAEELAHVPKELAAAYRAVVTQANGKLPWIAVTNGKDKGFSGPLPGTVNATMQLIQENM
mgnify:CR=1 FL=1